MNALVIDPKDTVAVVIEPVKQGDEVSFLLDGQPRNVEALSDITIYHKIAICRMEKGSPVVKYGEHIGRAAENIVPGEHVHVHNVESHRESL